MRAVLGLFVVTCLLAGGAVVDTGDGPAPRRATVPAPLVTGGPGVLSPPSMDPIPDLEAVLVAAGFDRPTAAVEDHRDRLYVAEKSGVVRVVASGTVLEQPLIDLDAAIPDRRVEQGLLGLALHPRFAESGLLYLNFTDEWGDTRIVEYRVVETSDGPVADPASARLVMWVDQPGQFHNGGMLQFDPEGRLFVGFGDGGFGDPQSNARNPRSVLGSIVRIDVDAARPYAVPADNPLVGTDAAPEVWAFGVRNPWRFFIDPVDRVVVVADVGQFTWEEISILSLDAGGYDLGWPLVEGPSCYAEPGCDPGAFVEPAYTYSHGVGCAVVGGPVYRGSAIPGLQGMVVYADFCGGFVRAFGMTDAAVSREVDLLEQAAHGPILSLAVDGDGEILVLTQFGEVRRLQPVG